VQGVTGIGSQALLQRANPPRRVDMNAIRRRQRAGIKVVFGPARQLAQTRAVRMDGVEMETATIGRVELRFVRGPFGEAKNAVRASYESARVA